MKKVTIICSVIFLCFLSMASKAQYITGTYSVATSALPWYSGSSWYGVIVLDDSEYGGTCFADSETDALSGNIADVNTPDTYDVYVGALTPYATCVVSTDAGTYFGSADSSGEVVIKDITVNSSVDISIY